MNKQQKLAVELFEWCLINRNDNFHVVFEMNSGADMIEVAYYRDGMIYKNKKPIFLSAIYLNDEYIDACAELSHILKTLKEEKAASDIRNSSENQEVLKEELRLREIAELKAKLKELESQ